LPSSQTPNPKPQTPNPWFKLTRTASHVTYIMSKMLILAIAAAVVAHVQVIEPADLVQAIDSASQNPPQNRGSLVYSLSLFGKILYDDQIEVTVLKPANATSNGCDTVAAPNPLPALPFVWLVPGGGCSFAAKGYLAQRSGSVAVIVYSNESDNNVKATLPINDSHCDLTSR
jgi:hypothetical protein